MNWCMVIVYTGFASLGGFLYGYDIGAINGAKETEGFRTTFNLSSAAGCGGSNVSNATSDSTDKLDEDALIGLIVATFPLGAALGTIIAAVTSEFIGRKYVIMVGSGVATVGIALQSASFFLWMLLVGRAISGIGVGVLFMVVPVCVGEIAPREVRGRMVLAFGAVGIPTGVLLGSVANLVLESYGFGWRVVTALQGIAGLSLFTSMLFLPETPRWLVKSGNEDRAEAVLRKVHGADQSQQVEAELRLIKESLEARKQLGSPLRSLCTRKMLGRVAMAACLQIVQKFLGVEVIFYYSVSIFCKLNLPPYVSTLVIAFAGILAMPFGIFLIDKAGRKTLLLLGALGMMVSIATAATLILVFRLEEGAAGGSSTNVVAGYTVVACICLFVILFTFTWGGVTFIVVTEIFPIEVKGIGVAAGTVTYFIGTIAVAQLTPILIDSPLQIYGTLYLLAFVHLVSYVFALLTLHETKGYSLEEIEELFSRPWLQRTRVFYYLLCGCIWSKRYNNLTRKEKPSKPGAVAVNPLYNPDL